MITTFSNHYKYQKMAGNIDFLSDSFVAILVDNTFTFAKDTHATLADVSANELTTGFGYTAGGIGLTLSGLVEDDTDDKATATFNTETWTASGGSIGPFQGVIIYDDTTADDTVVCFIDMESAITISDGGAFNLNSPEISEA